MNCEYCSMNLFRIKKCIEETDYVHSMYAYILHKYIYIFNFCSMFIAVGFLLLSWMHVDQTNFYQKKKKEYHTAHTNEMTVRSILYSIWKRIQHNNSNSNKIKLYLEKNENKKKQRNNKTYTIQHRYTQMHLIYLNLFETQI